MKYFKRIRDLFMDNRAATAIEYGLIAALIAMAIVAAVQSVGAKVAASFEATSHALEQ
ncbi:MAG: Flp family type IVb pilin [Porphyrobacter sp.]|nr:Flp family type IVb pilin [Porphyrobacter sp.]